MSFVTAMTAALSAWSAGNPLSEMDDRRLNDLGLNRYDLFDGRNLSASARGALYSARRSERAANWLR